MTIWERMFVFCIVALIQWLSSDSLNALISPKFAIWEIMHGLMLRNSSTPQAKSIRIPRSTRRTSKDIVWIQKIWEGIYCQVGTALTTPSAWVDTARSHTKNHRQQALSSLHTPLPLRVPHPCLANVQGNLSRSPVLRPLNVGLDWPAFLPHIFPMPPPANLTSLKATTVSLTSNVLPLISAHIIHLQMYSSRSRSASKSSTWQMANYLVTIQFIWMKGKMHCIMARCAKVECADETLQQSVSVSPLLMSPQTMDCKVRAQDLNAQQWRSPTIASTTIWQTMMVMEYIHSDT